jgi:hypothetical protein
MLEQPSLLDWRPSLGTRFDGATYDRSKDFERLHGNLRKVFDVLWDFEWHTAADIRERCGFGPEVAVKERVRDLRKPQVLGATILPRPIEGSKGVWEYRMLPPDQWEKQQT